MLHVAGNFTITLDDGNSFQVTHLPSILRITHPLNTYGQDDLLKEEIWIFGCSFTHGWSLNGQETFPWLIQQRFPEYEVINFGVNGYGTIRSLIQLNEALEKGRRPQISVLTYGSFHDESNVFLRIRRKNIVTWNKLGPLVQPYARLDSNGTLCYYLANVEYYQFLGMNYSALVHFIEPKFIMIVIYQKL